MEYDNLNGILKFLLPQRDFSCTNRSTFSTARFSRCQRCQVQVVLMKRYWTQFRPREIEQLKLCQIIMSWYSISSKTTEHLIFVEHTLSMSLIIVTIKVMTLAASLVSDINPNILLCDNFESKYITFESKYITLSPNKLPLVQIYYFVETLSPNILLWVQINYL